MSGVHNVCFVSAFSICARTTEAYTTITNTTAKAYTESTIATAKTVTKSTVVVARIIIDKRQKPKRSHDGEGVDEDVINKLSKIH